jgi:phospholipid/cholesterol/gamma-HCH transport system permease protein
MGMSTRGGTVGVGQATTRTVVITSVVTLILDFFLTKLFLGIGWGAG